MAPALLSLDLVPVGEELEVGPVEVEPMFVVVLAGVEEGVEKFFIEKGSALMVEPEEQSMIETEFWPTKVTQ